MFNKFTSLSVILILFIQSCTPPASEVTPRKQENYKKIDFHAHYRYDREYLLPLLESWNMQALLVDVAKEDSAMNLRQWEALKTQYNKYPNQFYLCASFESSNIDDPSFAEKIIEKLEDDFANGARMVKVWKVHGMVTRDSSGHFIQIDDPRIQPVWDYLTKKNIPVLAHIGEPLQAWQPLQEGNPHAGYYRDHPEYHAYNFPEIPSWETIMAARDSWIAKNPNLTIVAAHMGSMSHDLDLVAERLDKYPNMLVETAARWADIVLQDPGKVRNFFIKYQDRVIYGTDFGINTPEDPSKKESDQGTRDMINKRIDLHWQYVSGNDSLLFDRGSFKTQTHSINLPDSVLRKFYYDNATRVLNRE